MRICDFLDRGHVTWYESGADSYRYRQPTTAEQNNKRHRPSHVLTITQRRVRTVPKAKTT